MLGCILPVVKLFLLADIFQAQFDFHRQINFDFQKAYGVRQDEVETNLLTCWLYTRMLKQTFWHAGLYYIQEFRDEEGFLFHETFCDDLELSIS